MAVDQSFLSFFLNASPVVKAVMMLLLAASVFSWMFIFQRGLVLKRSRHYSEGFEKLFNSAQDFSKVYAESRIHRNQDSGLENIFLAGYKEYVHASQPNASSKNVFDRVQRAMRSAFAKEVENLEKHLAFLATVGSTSPYIGLFGTVWGIMTAFRALGHAQQATIAMVAPGISEALIATAIGLFAAIPAVIAYNRFSNDVDRLLNRYEAFQDEFSNMIERQNS